MNDKLKNRAAAWRSPRGAPQGYIISSPTAAPSSKNFYQPFHKNLNLKNMQKKMARVGLNKGKAIMIQRQDRRMHDKDLSFEYKK